MQLGTGNGIDEKSFRIKHELDDKFLSRLLSKETASSKYSNPSFRVYYGDVSSAVPFMWETRPGTPKHSTTCSDNFVPPLTPPPSYYTNKLNSSSKKQSRSKLIFHTLFRRVMSHKKLHVASNSSSSLSSISSSRSSFSSDSMLLNVYKRRRFASWGSSFDGGLIMDDHDGMCRSSSTRSCFAIGKKTLFSIVGRGSA